MNRTNTTAQTMFTITDPALATFNFSDRDNIQITVPAESTWRARYHWHSQGLGCEQIICTDGHLKVYYVSVFGSGGSGMPRGGSMRFKPGQRIQWLRDDIFKPKDLAVTLVADETLYRNTCSAILDADRFPHLATTPPWLRLLFTMLMWWPAAQRWLIARLLWVQLQAMHYSHDYSAYHGQLNVTSWWNWIHRWDWSRPPRWLVRFQFDSQTVFSSVVQTACYWAGRSLLGMKGQYAEYTPQRPGSHMAEIKC